MTGSFCINLHLLWVIENAFQTLICGSSDDSTYAFVKLSVCLVMPVECRIGFFFLPEGSTKGPIKTISWNLESTVNAALLPFSKQQTTITKK